MGNWCEVIGGYNDTKCTSWTPTQNNYTNKPIGDCIWGDSPVSHLHVSDLPITWQITENFSIKLEDVSESATRQIFKITVYYDNNEMIIDSGIALGASSESSFGIGFGYQDSDTASSRYGFICVFKHIVNEAPNTINIVSRPSSLNENRTLYPYIKAAIIPPDLNRSGGAGSGYIGNSLLSNKKMVGYNVPTSSAESTKTESVNEASENPVSGKPKIGNGFARIKFLRTIAPPDEWKDICEVLQSYNMGTPTFNFLFTECDEYQGRSGYYKTGSAGTIGTFTFPVSIVGMNSNQSSSYWDRSNIDYHSVIFTGVGTIKLTSDGNGGYTAEYTGFDDTIRPFDYNGEKYNGCATLYTAPRWGNIRQTYTFPQHKTSFSSISDAMNYIYNSFCHISLFVDGECWIFAK